VGAAVTVRPIRQIGDPVLRQKCPEVTEFDEALAVLVTDLMDTCRLPGRAGLAAPQIGVTRRVFSYNVEGVEGYVVNPVVVDTEGIQEAEEGCLSIPGVWMPSERSMKAVVAGVDLEGNDIEVEGTGLMARCLLHETDHLDGVLYIDRLPKAVRRQAMRELRNRGLLG
jgi:peptide deformylase